MLSDILNEEHIKYYSYVPADVLKMGHNRLYNSINKNSNVIFILLPYYVRETANKLAKFAAVPDYHLFAKDLFNKCNNYLSGKYPKCDFSGFADHSPFDERHGASLAGLGVLGRNGLLINREYSSYVFICEIVTSLTDSELESEGIPKGSCKTEYCENCGNCIKSCPGKCADGKKEELCISAISQKKQPLSESEISALLNSQYRWGCDVCANVCPYTERALQNGTLETPIPYFKNGVITGEPQTIIENLTDEEFKKYPFSWRKKEIILRNLKLDK